MNINYKRDMNMFVCSDLFRSYYIVYITYHIHKILYTVADRQLCYFVCIIHKKYLWQILFFFSIWTIQVSVS